MYKQWVDKIYIVSTKFASNSHIAIIIKDRKELNS